MTANQADTQSYEHWEPHDGQAALRNQITRTRADLGDTIAELASRADVKARARQAVADARTRARNAVRAKARTATMRAREGAFTATVRTQDAARAGASSARQMTARIARSPASIAVAGGAGALAGLGVYALVRRRLPLSGSPFMRLRPLMRLRLRRAMGQWR